jgi:hypothetical protein
MREPLSYRDGGKPISEWEGPFEGIPDWLWSAFLGWLTDLFRVRVDYGEQVWDTNALRSLEQFMRTSFDWSLNNSPLQSLLANCRADQEFALDVADWCLANLETARSTAPFLDRSLSNSGSVWRVDVDENDFLQLQRRVDGIVTSAVKSAAKAGSKSQVHLRQAWSNVYGHSGDPSVAYREAVKAVEAAAIPVVSPANSSATLGTIIADMKAKPAKWKCALQPAGDLHAIEQVIGILSLLWKSQLDRHGHPDPTAPISANASEAEAALHLAAALVHMFDSGVIQIA